MPMAPLCGRATGCSAWRCIELQHGAEGKLGTQIAAETCDVSKAPRWDQAGTTGGRVKLVKAMATHMDFG